MSTRDTIHALVDDLDEMQLDLAKQALQEIRDDGYDLTASEERELLEREEECERGEVLNAREFLTALRRERHPDSNG